jgi:spore coat polysaccharide biosynthesis predicted glycosyltransferase SpsG/RimJ/RimL family protein N-acetyltransferase
MRIGFRIDAGTRVGLGHFFRSLALSEELLDNGHEVFFISRDLSSWLAEEAARRGVGIALLPTSPKVFRTVEISTWLGAPPAQDSFETLKICRSLRIEALWIDHYGVNPTWTQKLKEMLIPISQITDFPALQEADTIVDYGFDANLSKHAENPESHQRFLLGPNFTSISKYSTKSPVNKETSSKTPAKVLIALGSAITPDFIEDLEKTYLRLLPDFDMDLAADSQILSFSRSARTVRKPAEFGLGRRIASSSFAVTSAGVTMYERIAYGTPGLIIPTASNQNMSLEALKRNSEFSESIVEIVNLEPSYILGLLTEKIATKSTPEEELLLQSTVDFFGPRRIAFFSGLTRDSAIKSRTLKDTDGPLLFRWVNDPSVRSSAINTQNISAGDHLRWFRRMIRGDSPILVFEKSGIPFGQVRFDRIREGEYTVDYSIDRLFRGLGLGREMIETAIRDSGISGVLDAEVRVENIASIKTLMKAGFGQNVLRKDTIVLRKLVGRSK